MGTLRSLRLGALGFALCLPAAARAGDQSIVSSDVFRLNILADETTAQPDKTATVGQQKTASPGPPVAAAPAAETPNIHGFAAISVRNSYITPRGLVVQNDEFTIQPIFGLVLPIDDKFTFIGGVWNNITTAQDDSEVGPWNEMDPFFTLAYSISKEMEFSVTYVPFISPNNAFDTEHNIEFALKYTGIDVCEGLTLNPYAKFFWAVSGDSTVVLGREGDTFDVELGVVPTFVLNKGGDVPLTISMATYFTVGPKSYWGGDNNFGVASTGINVNIPLKFIPGRFGNWSTDVGFNYYYLLNGSLVDSATILGSGDGRNWGVGYVSVGFKF